MKIILHNHWERFVENAWTTVTTLYYSVVTVVRDCSPCRECLDYSHYSHYTVLGYLPWVHQLTWCPGSLLTLGVHAQGLRHLVYMCVCLSVCICVCSNSSHLSYCAFGHQTRGISGYSAENAAKLKSSFR